MTDIYDNYFELLKWILKWLIYQKVYWRYAFRPKEVYVNYFRLLKWLVYYLDRKKENLNSLYAKKIIVLICCMKRFTEDMPSNQNEVYVNYFQLLKWQVYCLDENFFFWNIMDKMSRSIRSTDKHPPKKIWIGHS